MSLKFCASSKDYMNSVFRVKDNNQSIQVKMDLRKVDCKYIIFEKICWL